MYVVLTHQQEVYDLTSDQRVALKDFLTFNNPAYKAAKKFNRYGYISVPPYLTYYQDKKVVKDGKRYHVMYIPSGVNLKKVFPEVESCKYRDLRKDVPVDYPEFSLTLRDDQKKAEEAYLQKAVHPYSKRIIQLPTGKGKTILALHLAKTLGQKTLVLVHKDDLVQGWNKDIELCFPGMKVGLIKASNRRVGEQITIGTVQTLSRMSPDDLEALTDAFGFVILDETHHLGAKQFNVIGMFNSKYKLGLTATPTRNDGLDFLFNVFLGGVCYTHKVTEDDSDISQVEVRPLEVRTVYKPFVFDGRVYNAGDYSEDELPDNPDYVENMHYGHRPLIPYLTIDSSVVLNEETIRAVCKSMYDEYNQGHSILALFSQKIEVETYYERLKGFVSEDEMMMYYGDSKESTADMIELAESSKVRITFATYSKASEGTNVKAWEVLYLVSSRNNAKDLEQATGRIRRRKKGKLDPVRVYDVRYPNCYSLCNHARMHNQVFKKLGYIMPTETKAKKRNIFSRGYH